MAGNLVSVLKNLKMPTVLLGSNIDAGSDEVSKVIRNWLESEQPDYVFATKHLHPDDFYRYLSAAACAVGNSSSFIREGAYFGTPVVLISSRQNKRERAENIIEISDSKKSLKEAVLDQISHGRFSSSRIFGDGKTSQKIAEVLSSVNLEVQKSFNDL